jgi:hypothetical protein
VPFVSKAQQRWAHTSAGKQALGPAGVAHWDKATTNYKQLPERVPKRPGATPMADMFKQVMAEKFK